MECNQFMKWKISFEIHMPYRENLLKTIEIVVIPLCTHVSIFYLRIFCFYACMHK